MPLRKLLVGLADPDTAPRVMDAAATLARAHEAHLLAVHVVPSGVTREGGLPVSDALERLREVYESRRDDAAFSSEWRVLDDDALSARGALAELGNACDALVLGQRHAREAGRAAWHLGEHIVGIVARPVLLVPETASARGIAAERVLVAWDGEAASTRALFEALPLLERAAEVRVHRFNPPRPERDHVAGLAESLAATLGRHGVPVELSHADASRLEIGEEIVVLARDFGAELLVAGTRRHTAARRFLFGDTTRHLFEHAPCPLLLGG